MALHKVLVVDDEKDVLNGILMLNQRPDREFKTASNGLEALELVKSETFGVIVSDVTMPKMSGVDFLKQARALGVKTPFIFISGQSDDLQDQLKGLEPLTVIEKTEIKQLKALINEHLSKG